MNFQQIPRANKIVKRAFVPKLDAFASFDYEQIEYRILAYYLAIACGDKDLADTFRRGEDLHARTASLMLGREAKSDDDRQVGKTGNFSIIYAGGVPTILSQFKKHGIEGDRAKAKALLKKMHEGMPSVRIFMDQLAEEIAFKGYVFDIFGRHYRPDPSIPYHDAVRKIIAQIIQGSAAGLLREAIVKVGKGLADCQAHIVNVVHDEILIDSPEDELDYLKENVPQWMNNTTYADVLPITAGMEVSFTNWADKEPYDTTN